MKKITKICLIVAGIFAGLGLVLFIIGISLGFGLQQFRTMVDDGNFLWKSTTGISINNNIEHGNSEHSSSHHNTEQAWLEEKYVAEDVKNLDIEVEAGTLILEPTDGRDIEIEAGYQEQNNSHSRSVTWKMIGNTLEIKDTPNRKFFKIVDLNDSDAILTIRIPSEKNFDEISIEAGASTVIVETELIAREMDIVIGAGKMKNGKQQSELLQAQELSLEIGAGSMEFSGIMAGKLEIDCGAGSMKLADVSVNHTELECGVGAIFMELTGQQLDYNYEVDCGIGQVNIGDSSYSGLGASKKINNGGNKYLDIDCGIGEVAISFEG